MTKKGWLIATILTLLTVSAWVISDIIHTHAQVQIPSQLQTIIEPISPDFDTRDLQSAP